MTTRNSPLRINELSRITRTLFRQHHHGVGLFILIATLFVLSFLAGLQPPMQFRVFMAGEVADSDVVAHRSLTVEDTEAAKIKRNQVAMLQPTVFDLSVTEIAALRQKIFGMLKLINGQETSPEAQDALRASLAEKLATPVSSDLLAQWMSPEVQEYVLSTGLPWFEDRLREGVVVKGISMKNLAEAIRTVVSGKAMINPEITDKVVKLFNHMAQSSYAIQVDNELTEELTKTEWRVIQKIGCGMSNKEIASELVLSEGTVRNYLSSVLSKLELRDRTQLAIWAVQAHIP